MSADLAGLVLTAALWLDAWLQSRMERSGPTRDKVCGGLVGLLAKDRDREFAAEILGPVRDRDGGAPA